MKITIKVTAEDIKKGVRGDSMKCMVARAVKRHFKELRIKNFAGAIHSEILIDDGSPTYKSILFPKKVGEAIRKFDIDKKSVKPFSFTINVRKELLPKK